MMVETFEKGQTIIRSGTKPHGVFVVISGNNKIIFKTCLIEFLSCPGTAMIFNENNDPVPMLKTASIFRLLFWYFPVGSTRFRKAKASTWIIEHGILKRFDEFGAQSIFSDKNATVSVYAMEAMSCYRLLDERFREYLQPSLLKLKNLSDVYRTFQKQFV